MKRVNALFLGLFAGLIVLDQLSKLAIVKLVPLYGTVTVIPGFFDITHIRNKGAIFGLFNRSGATGVTALLLLASLAAMGIVLFYFFRTPENQRWTKAALSLILAGAVGNQIDRLVRGFVVDFLEMHVKGFYWPTYNVADASISVGAVLLAAIVIFRRS
jgi:signal peptidase II